MKTKFLFFIQFFAVLVCLLAPSSSTDAWTGPRMRKSSVNSCSPSAPTSFTWKGTINNSWSTAGNWHGGVVPGPSDVAIFDNNCSTNCTPTFSGSVDVAGINMRCSFTGNISQGGNSFNVGASGWIQDGGTFTGGSASMTIGAGGMTLSGGTFNAPATASLDLTGPLNQTGGVFNASGGPLYIYLEDVDTTAFSLTGGSFTSPTSTFTVENYHLNAGNDCTLFSKSSAATFNHNNGTVIFEGHDSASGSNQFTIDVSGNLNLNNVTVAGSSSYGQGHRLAPGSTITVLGTFDHTGGLLLGGNAGNPDTWGEWLLKGATNNFGSTAGYAYGSYGTVRFAGTGNQTYTCNMDVSEAPPAHFKVDKPSGTLTTSSSNCHFASLDLVQGSFTAPTGTLTLGFWRYDNNDIIPDIDWSIFKIAAGTTFTHSSGTVDLWWRDAGGCCESASVLVDVPSNFTFNNLTIRGTSTYWSAGGVKINSGSVIVQNTFKWLGGRLFSDWNLKGDAYMNSPAGYTGAWGDASGNGPATFTFSGTGAQKVYSTGLMSLGNVTVNKSSGTLTLDDNFTISDAAQNMTVTAGTVNMMGYNLSIGSNLTIAASATVTCNNGVLSYGSLTNNGTLNCTPATHTFTSVGSIASAQSKTQQVNWSFAPSAQLNAGNLGVLVISGDNYDDLDRDDGTVVSVTDSVGNIWKKRGEYQYGGTGAGDGATVSVWTTVATTNLTTGGTITVNFWDDGVGITAKAATGWQFSYTGGSALHVAGYSTLAENGDPSNMTLSGLTSYPYLWIRAVGQEDSATSWTPSASHTTFTHTSSTTSGSTAPTNIGARGEFRIFTGTSNSTNPSGSNKHNASIYLVVQ